MKRPTRVTLSEVAKSAGVSPKTASRILNGVETVDPDMRRRVNQAVEKLGYRPNRYARLLSGGKSTTLAFLMTSDIGDEQDPRNRLPSFVLDVLAGALRACRDASYSLTIFDIGRDRDMALKELNRLIDDSPIDGILLMPPWCDVRWLLDFLAEQDIPVGRVLAGTEQNRGCCASVDNKAAAREVANLILANGHRRIGLIEAPEGHSAGTQRCKAFRLAIEENRGTILTVKPGDFFFNSGYLAGVEMLDQSKRPTAIFAANDEMAAGVLAAARDKRIAVPEDLSIVGYGDLLISKQTWPRLTTVGQPIIDMAHDVVEALTKLTPRDKTYQLHLQYSHSFIERETLANVPKG